MNKESNAGFGVLKPVGHVVVSLPDAELADAAAHALARLGVQGGELLRRYSDREMLAQIDRDLRRASPLASGGEEFELIQAHRELAARGYHWLVVRADSDEQAAVVATCVRPYGAERAHHYGHQSIDELIGERDGVPAPLADPPDSGLDSTLPGGPGSTPPWTAR